MTEEKHKKENIAVNALLLHLKVQKQSAEKAKDRIPSKILKERKGDQDERNEERKQNEKMV